MNPSHAFRSLVFSTAVFLAAASAFAPGAQAQDKPFEPVSGQPGKDVVWVPTPQPLVETMLDTAKLTPQDFHMDLGAGDGRTVITAAKRGARSEGIEYNPDMVALSERNAKAAGVTARATFRKADLFETDFSKAQVITLFLLPTINLKLRPQILDMKPGTRIVSNTFTRSEEHTSELQSPCNLVCRLLLEKKKKPATMFLRLCKLAVSCERLRFSPNLDGALNTRKTRSLRL